MKKVYLSSENSPAPYSGAVEANGLVFLAGQIHLIDGQLQGGTIEQKFEIAVNNAQRILANVGLTLDDVVKVQLFLTDLSQLPAINKIYANYFKHPLPARTAIGVTALPLGADIEIDIIAAR